MGAVSELTLSEQAHEVRVDSACPAVCHEQAAAGAVKMTHRSLRKGPMNDALSLDTPLGTTHEGKTRLFYAEHGLLGYTRGMENAWLHESKEDMEAGTPHPEGPLRQAAFLVKQVAPGISDGDLVLDFGSGPGGATIHMAQQLMAERGSRVRMLGVCNDESCNAYARALADKEGLTGQVSFLTVGDLDYRAMPWPDGSFAGIVCSEAACHLPAKQEFLHQMYRLLRPGGRMAFMDWIQRPFGSLTAEEIKALIDPVCEHISLAGLETVDSYTKMLENAGFTIEFSEDMYKDTLCMGSTDADRKQWEEDPDPRIRAGMAALYEAKKRGPFSVAQWVVVKPAA